MEQLLSFLIENLKVRPVFRLLKYDASKGKYSSSTILLPSNAPKPQDIKNVITYPDDITASNFTRALTDANQNKSIDIALFPYAYIENTLVYYLFILDIDECPVFEELERFLKDIEQALQCSHLLLLETSPSRYAVYFLIEKSISKDIYSYIRNVIMSIATNYPNIKIDENSFNPSFPFRFPYTYNYKRSKHRTQVLSFNIEAIPIVLEFDGVIDTFETHKDIKKIPQQFTLQEQLLLLDELLSQLGLRKQFKRTAKGEYMLVNCLFHPPDYNPSATFFISYAYNLIFYVDFHNSTKLPLTALIYKISKGEVPGAKHLQEWAKRTYNRLYRIKNREREVSTTRQNEKRAILELMRTVGKDVPDEDRTELLVRKTDITEEDVSNKIKQISDHLLDLLDDFRVVFKKNKFYYTFYVKHPRNGEIMHFVLEEHDAVNYQKFFKHLSAAFFMPDPTIYIYIFPPEIAIDASDSVKFKRLLKEGYAKFLEEIRYKFDIDDKIAPRKIANELFQRLVDFLMRTRKAEFNFARDKDMVLKRTKMHLEKDIITSIPFYIDEKEDILIPEEIIKRAIRQYEIHFLYTDAESFFTLMFSYMKDAFSVESLSHYIFYRIPKHVMPQEFYVDPHQKKPTDDMYEYLTRNLIPSELIPLDLIKSGIVREVNALDDLIYYSIVLDGERKTFETWREFIHHIYIAKVGIKVIISGLSSQQLIEAVCNMLSLKYATKEDGVYINSTDVYEIYELQDIGSEKPLFHIQKQNEESESSLELF